VFNAIFNNISVISWRSVLLVEETVVPGENRRPVAILPLYHVEIRFLFIRTDDVCFVLDQQRNRSCD